MNFQRQIAVLLALLPLILASGCATPKLWNESALSNRNIPDSDSHLRLYHLPKQKEFIVVYNEYSERHDAVRPRAYLLYANQTRIRKGRQPDFISTNLLASATPVPVFKPPLSPPEPRPPLFVLHNPSQLAFVIYTGDEVLASAELPSYDDGTGLVKKVLLTPATLTADATILGGILGAIWLEAGAPH